MESLGHKKAYDGEYQWSKLAREGGICPQVDKLAEPLASGRAPVK